MSCRQIRELERYFIDDLQVPGLLLMENAAVATTRVACELLANIAGDNVIILVGPGNNGGDGLATARLLMAEGFSTHCVLSTAPEKLRGDAAANFKMYQSIAGSWNVWTESREDQAALSHRLQSCHLVIDALLGSGAAGNPRGVIAALIDLANRARRPKKLAIDMPSGLNADSGERGAACFEADATVTFVAAKLGFATPAAQAVLGQVTVASIGVPITGREQSQAD
jgi:NAD(P)H-hydrate epimerase